jgi:hypothetical protein
MKVFVALLLCLSAPTLLAQQSSSAAKAPHVNAAVPTPKAAAPAAKPAEAPKPIDPAAVKALRDSLEQLQMDGVSVQNARDKVMQTDQIAKQAVGVLNDRMASNEDVQKATAKATEDRTQLLAKIATMRKEQHLDDTYDWDFQRGVFVKSATPPQQAPAK